MVFDKGAKTIQQGTGSFRFRTRELPNIWEGLGEVRESCLQGQLSYEVGGRQSTIAGQQVQPGPNGGREGSFVPLRKTAVSGD